MAHLQGVLCGVFCLDVQVLEMGHLKSRMIPVVIDARGNRLLR
jgi:hypothetical protein